MCDKLILCSFLVIKMSLKFLYLEDASCQCLITFVIATALSKNFHHAVDFHSDEPIELSSSF